MAYGKGVRLVLVFALAASLASAAFSSSISFSKVVLPGTVDGGFEHADLNNDGREDFVRFVDGGFDVVLSTGDGTYAAPVSYQLSGGFDTFSGKIGDFNNDRNADLIVSGSDGTLRLFLNNGHGVFTQKAAFKTQLQNMEGMVVGDFNHDGLMDIAMSNYQSSGSRLVVWFGNGKSGFTIGPTTPITNTFEIVLGDFDGDGHADLALQGPPAGLEVLYGDGKGRFPVTAWVEEYDALFWVADVDGDGKSDVIAITPQRGSTGGFSVAYGNTARTWLIHHVFTTAHLAQTATAADVNGDGLNDLIVQEVKVPPNADVTDYVGVLTRNSNGTYNPEQIVLTSANQGLLSVMQANGDGKADLVLPNCAQQPCGPRPMLILRNTTAGNFPSCAPPKGFEGINVCSPAAGATVTSPVSFKVGAAGQVPMRDVEVWVDGKKLALQLDGFSNYTFLNRSLNLSAGTHAVAIFAAGWDQSLQKKTFTLNVK